MDKYFPDKARAAVVYLSHRLRSAGPRHPNHKAYRARLGTSFTEAYSSSARCVQLARIMSVRKPDPGLALSGARTAGSAGLHQSGRRSLWARLGSAAGSSSPRRRPDVDDRDSVSPVTPRSRPPSRSTTTCPASWRKGPLPRCQRAAVRRNGPSATRRLRTVSKASGTRLIRWGCRLLTRLSTGCRQGSERPIYPILSRCAGVTRCHEGMARRDRARRRPQRRG